MQRAALYIRVSTEEQALHGYSLDAQQEALVKYAHSHDLLIVDTYKDEGKSARKPYHTRPEFMRMLGDVERGKIDLILFIKLDRWFRSVGEYYKVQEILEKYNVNWRTVQEDYDTSTASGRLKINIMLSVAQDEADRTSERIKFVFENKVAKGEAITGKVPFGYRVEGKRLVHDPERAGIVRDMFRHFDEHGSKHGAIMFAWETYGVKVDRHSFQHMLHNTIYKGEYRGNVNYCEPIIDPEVFDRLSQTPNARKNQTKRVYIFSGMVMCAECGQRMTGRHSGNRDKNGDGFAQEYIYYRCNRYSNFKDCVNGKLINEEALEKWLLENIETEIEKCIADFNTEVAKRSGRAATVDRAAIKRKLARLKDLYVDEVIDMATYRADYDRYTAMLAASEPEAVKPPFNKRALEELLGSGFKDAYEGFDREERRAFWRGVVREIRVSVDHGIGISFV